MMKVDFSVLTPVYNEAKNIDRFITSVQGQKLDRTYRLVEILIIASGCSDDTVNIIKSIKKRDKRIRLITQRKRKGKATAVNVLLKQAKTKLLILQSADTIPARTCYSKLLEVLVEPKVGLVAGKIVPKDKSDNLIGFANRLKWKLHHEINLQYTQRPKVGELIAFKKTFDQIPSKTAVDEASIEPLIHLQGFKIKYVPNAIIYNQGPRTVREFLSQRRRIYAGHFITKKKYAYEIVTFSGLRILPIFVRNLKLQPKFILYATATMFLELFARLVGYIDVKLKLRDHSVWKIAKTSKKI